LPFEAIEVANVEGSVLCRTAVNDDAAVGGERQIAVVLGREDRIARAATEQRSRRRSRFRRRRGV
jgi:hypothetical protein